MSHSTPLPLWAINRVKWQHLKLKRKTSQAFKSYLKFSTYTQKLNPKEEEKNMPSEGTLNCIDIILAIILPPLGVFFKFGCHVIKLPFFNFFFNYFFNYLYNLSSCIQRVANSENCHGLCISCRLFLKVCMCVPCF